MLKLITDADGEREVRAKARKASARTGCWAGTDSALGREGENACGSSLSAWWASVLSYGYPPDLAVFMAAALC